MTLSRLFATLALVTCFAALAFAPSAVAAPYANDFGDAGAIDISGTRGTTTADLSGATRESGEPTVAGSDTAHTVWWRYSPAETGFARFSTCRPTGMDPVPELSLGVYTGGAVDSLTPVAQGTNNCPSGYENAVVGPFAVTAGNFYWLQIGGASSLSAGESDLSLTLDFNTTVPVNDDWASAMTISGALPQTFAVNNGLATVETGEPFSGPVDERQTLWWKWTPAASGVVAVDTCGSTVESGQDSVITIFEGTVPSPTGFGDLSSIVDADRGCSATSSNLTKTFASVTAGNTYWFKLSNYTKDWGFPYTLQFKMVVAPDYADPPAISSGTATLKVGNTAFADEANWAMADTITHQWRRCDAAGANCVNIGGANNTSYVIQAADVGHTLRFRQTGTNTNGSTIADSDASGLVDNTPANNNWASPTNLGSGSSIDLADDNFFATTEIGEPTVGGGTFNTVWYTWTPSVSGNFTINNCLGTSAPDYLDLVLGVYTGTGAITSAVSQSVNDNGCGPKRASRSSLALNATAGTTYHIQVGSRFSGFTGNYRLQIYPAGNPVVTEQPTLSGTAAVNNNLVLDMGDWISPAAAVLSPVVNWYKCDASGNNCGASVQSGGTVFSIPLTYGGSTVKASIQLTDPYGTVTTSVTSAVIPPDADGDGVDDSSDACPTDPGAKPNGCPPSDIVGTAVPTLSGNFMVGQTITSTEGSWDVLYDQLGYTPSYKWQRCTTTAPASCADISGANASTYQLVAGDLTRFIRSVVTASNPDDTEIQYSAISVAVTAPPSPPANSAPPVVSGDPIVGEDLTTTDGTWTPAGVGFEYQWRRCTTTALGSCSDIVGATANTYTLVSADLGHYIRMEVTGTNISGSATATSASTAIVTGDTDGDGVPDVYDTCPADSGTKPNGCNPSVITGTGVPTIAGTLQVGQTINSSQGTWTVDNDPLGYNVHFQWQRCDTSAPASCADIPGQTSDTYVLAQADYLKYMRVVGTASNPDDSDTQFSDVSAVVTQIPGALSAPVVSGSTVEGDTLSTTDGIWVPFDTTFSHAWLRCTNNTAVGSCSPIASATASTYTLTAADIGQYIRSRVTGTNGSGSDSAESPATPIVVADTDADNDGVDDINDDCPAEPGDGRPNGCPASVLVPQSIPTIVGATQIVGVSTSSTPGTWSVLHDQLGYGVDHQWQICTTTSTATCSDIGSATGSSYTPVAADYGKYLRLQVTASNADDSDVQFSAVGAKIEAFPENQSAPTATGTALEGATLAGDQGTWTPADAALTNSWQRCDDATLGSCSTIPGEIGTSYTLVSTDIGKYIRFRVTGTTAVSFASVSSDPVGPIEADSDGDGVGDGSDACPAESGTKPNGCNPSEISNVAIPVISGTLEVGSLLATSDGAWSMLGEQLTLSYDHQWQRCTTTSAASCSDITGETGGGYTLAQADYGHYMRARVTASNADDSEIAYSDVSARVSQYPSPTGASPQITGTRFVGSPLGITPGVWTPSDAALTYEWMLCDTASSASCNFGSPHATGSSYVPTGADVGKYFLVREFATTTAGVASRDSSTYGPIIVDSDGDGIHDGIDACPAEAGDGRPNGCPPSDVVAVTPPVISGTLNVGETISADNGVWNILHDQLALNYDHQWQRCDSTSTASCSDIASANASSYALVSGDYGKYIRVSVTASNADDSATQFSAISAQISEVPSNITLPTVSGAALTSATLTGTQGTWSPFDAVLTNEWLRCDDATINSCSVIAGESGSTYDAVAGDDGKYIRLRVQATAAGSVTATSSALGPIRPDADDDGVADDGPDQCLGETGTKPNGCLPSDFVALSPPTLSGSLLVGSVVSAVAGGWNVLHDPLPFDTDYQWQICTTTAAASCSDLAGPGADTQAYPIVAADYGKYLRVRETVSNPDDTDFQYSAISGRIEQVPTNNTLPSVTGTTTVGQTLSGSQGSWDPVDATLTNSWLRCDDATLGSCTPIGDSGSTYTLVAADEGKRIRLQVDALTAAGNDSATSAATAIVIVDADGDGVADGVDACLGETGTKPNGCLPSDVENSSPPVISGTLEVGFTLSATDGVWSMIHDQLTLSYAHQWQRCTSSAPASCSDIAGETANTITLGAADYGNRVRVRVTASNADDSAQADSAISDEIWQEPSNVTPPTISGIHGIGQTLTAQQGTWIPAAATLNNEWLRCDDNVSTASCSLISGETGSTYVTTAADNHKYIRIRVNATTPIDNTFADSDPTLEIVSDSDGDGIDDVDDTCPAEAGDGRPNGCQPSDIVGTGPPVISGDLTVGQALSATDGVWNVLHDPLSYTVAHQWQSCTTPAPASCSDLPGHTANSYTLGSGEYGHYMRVRATASNADDSEDQFSAITTVVSEVPTYSSPPSVAGIARVGVELAGNHGVWQPADTTFDYQWLRCTDQSGPASCAPISGETGTYYTLQAADDGQYLRFQVTATTTSGTAVTESAPTDEVYTDSDLDGVHDADDTCPLVAGTKPNGCEPSEIFNSSPPVVTGNLVAGDTLTTSDGVWNVVGEQLGYSVSREWLICADTSLASCSSVSGEVGSTFTIPTGVFGSYVRSHVTASNADDSTDAYSAPVGPTDEAPFTILDPSISGTAEVGSTLSSDDGQYGPSNISTSRIWLRCDDALYNGCATISGETGSSYAITAPDYGKYLVLRVHVSNSVNDFFAVSPPSAQVGAGILDTDGDGVLNADDTCPADAGDGRANGCPPSDIQYVSDPTISGTLRVGQSLSAVAGGWNVLGDPLALTHTYAWDICATSNPITCSSTGSTGTSFALTGAHYNQYVRVTESVSNADDSDSATSAIYGPIDEVPTNSVLPSLSGIPAENQLLTAADGTWSPAGLPLTYAWLRCDDTSLSNCVTVGGEASATFTPSSADVGKYIRVQVTGSNGAGSLTVESAPAGPITAAPVDTDGDGIFDGPDACPTEFGDGRPNGCPPSDVSSTSIPVVTGTPAVGQVLASDGGTFGMTGDQLTLAISHAWERCDTSSPATCSPIGGAIASSYTLTAADYGKYVRSVVTATNADDSASHSSALASPIYEVPVNGAPPTISGNTTVGSTLTADPGAWTPADAAISYAWQRCTTTSTSSCVPIPSATAQTYLLTAADDLHYIRVGVTATSGPASTLANSVLTAQVIVDSDGDGVSDPSDACPADAGDGRPNGCPPSVVSGTGAPTLSGTFEVGQTVSTTDGSWSMLHDQLTLSYARQWQRCDTTSPASCSDIATETGTNYTITGADYGKRLRSVVTASNADDNDVQASAISAAVSQVPAVITAPTISGTAAVGQTLSSSQGNWTPADATIVNQWMRCSDNTSTASCSAIGSATGSSYTLVAADDSTYIRLRETATTTAGSTQAFSAPSALVNTPPVDSDGDGIFDGSDACPADAGDGRPNGCPPSDIVGVGAPTLSGTFNVGQTISTTDGAWNVLHDQLGFTTTRQWQRCDTTSTASCSDIATETGTSYTITGADYGKRIRSVVTASNADDSDVQASAISAAVSQIPVNNTAPSISGTAQVGSTLTASQGTWTPADATLTNVWLRCTDLTLGSCAAIGGETGSTYTLAAADLTRYIRLTVTATTAAGTDSLTTAPIGAIAAPDGDGDGVPDAGDACPSDAGDGRPNGCPPSVVTASAAPVISGTLQTLSTLSSTNGTFTVTGDQLALTYSHQWQSCDDTSTASCADISGATGATYALTSAELGKYIRVIVTATNADDSDSIASAISATAVVVAPPPVNTVLPDVSGTAEVGQLLSTSGGTWTPAETVLTYEWLRCDDATPGACTPITSMTSAAYQLTAADLGKFIRVRVTGTANLQTDTVVSNSTAQVASAPVTPGPTPPTTKPVNPAQILGPKKGKVITVRVNKKGQIYVSRVSVYCRMESKGDCSGTVSVRATVGGKRVEIGGFKLKTLRGGGRTLRINLSKGALSHLKKHPTLSADLSVTYKSPGVSTSRFSAKLKIKRR